MGQELILSGVGTTQYGLKLRASLAQTNPGVVAIASAFVSVGGIAYLIETLNGCGRPDCRLIAGTDHAITHPAALYWAREQGWSVRLGQAARGIFHPKMVLAGRRFSREGTINGLCCTYVGSSNLTIRGLKKNVECGIIADAESCLPSMAAAFAGLWNAATPASDAVLRNYSARFAERARERTVSQLQDLEIGDESEEPIASGELPARKLAPAAIHSGFAVAAWAGLQSFTGEYRFQVEFPRDAGSVISQIIGVNARADGRIDVDCPSDQQTRTMQYGFYPHNGMFRLNIPNDVPGVAWARAHRDGIAIVEKGPPGGAPLRIRVVRPGVEMREAVGRSYLLGTWGRTPTRPYGWY